MDSKSNTTTLVSFKGKSVYRKCSCGETAHDASAILVREGDAVKPSGLFQYKCRNCFKVANFVAPAYLKLYALKKTLKEIK